MPKYVAFLRAINVGGHTVKMERLRALFEELAFSNIETFIASGNVIFDSPSKSSRTLERNIEGLLRSALGYEVATFIRSVSEVAEIARYKAFPDADSHTLYIVFIRDEPGADVEKKLLSCNNRVDEFHVKGRTVFWLCRKKFSASEFSGALLEKTIQMPATIRNANTIRKIATKYS